MLKIGDTAHLDPGFQALTKLAYREAGLVLSPSKAAMIQSRLRHRLRALGLQTLQEYCDYVNTVDTGMERRHMISALTTNVSGFFREPHHFEQMSKDLVPHMIQRLKAGQPVRIWSAGCSNGQEPYSIAMLLLEHDPIFGTGDLRILATDIDPQVVHYATTGLYEPAQVCGLSDERRKRFTEIRAEGAAEPRHAMAPILHKMIVFKELNLIGPWPMQGQFDAIFCRNVVIYFDAPTQDKLWSRFATMLRQDGIVFVGHSERINSPMFRTAGATSYRKTGATGSGHMTQNFEEDG